MGGAMLVGGGAMSSGYLCQNPACARPMPRVPQYCPYCGTRQSGGVALHKQGAGAATITPPSAASAYAAAPAAIAAAQPPAAGTPAAGTPAAGTPAATITAQQYAGELASPAPSSPTTVASAPAGHPAAPRPAPTKLPPFIAPRPKRKPWWRWLLVVLILLSLWNLLGKSGPGSKALDARLTALQTLVDECKLDRARQELPALRKLDADKARDWQAEIDKAKPACDERHARERDWSNTLAMVNKALDDANFDKPAYDKLSGHLNWFNKKWQEDQPSRELRQKLDARYALYQLQLAQRCSEQANWGCLKQRLGQWERLKSPEGQAQAEQLRAQLAAQTPAGKAGGGADSAVAPANPAAAANPGVAGDGSRTAGRPVLTEAQKTAQHLNQVMADAQEDMAVGNYKSVVGKMDVCLAMIDPGNVNCQTLRKKAERLNKEMLRCVNGGHEWIGDNCSK